MRLPDDTDLKSPSVNILPMIDVIFAILAFFILSTLYLTKAEGLPVNLPQAATATPENQIDATVTITPDGSLFLNSQAIALRDLAASVSAIASNQPVMITIRADEATPHGKVVAAMDQLRKVNDVRLGIATTQP